ncbi:hypothetical protein [Saccharomonospora sp. CUA-673]|uniref:hypothetical protein n=1 Tax=Saccharomonospora sp. CUA-673 TaxID=1904969 RepID=UPI00111511C3|nr:hypothetical protein [Saccharomonospora sp. CUA-673]
MALVNIAGVGVLAGSDVPSEAERAVEFLLSESTQQYFADELAEFPMRDGITSETHDMPELEEISSPDIDLSDLSSLDETLTLLQEVGLS